jgi:starch synthase
MKVLFVSSEAVPFAFSGGLGEVAGALPKALVKKGVDCRVIMPLYEQITPKMREKFKFLGHFDVPLAWRTQYCGVFTTKYNGVTYYFVDNEYYFKRSGLYGYYDDGERFAFFSKAVLEAIAHIGFKPDVIHCNDWQTALIPPYYSIIYSGREGYENIRTMFTIHNIQYQGIYGKEILNEVIGVSQDKYPVFEYDDCINFMKAAIECANKVSTVSPTYAQEILDPWYSYGLDNILRRNLWKFTGILNGIDDSSYDPATDEAIAMNYDANRRSGKRRCKEALQKEFGFKQNNDVPIIALVSRLVSHKGLDLVSAVIDELLYNSEVRVIVLGAGDSAYENYFRGVCDRHPDKFRLYLGFDPDLARRIYAGADMFLMPSKNEPCGLSQMIALRYGTVPIVRETGGLADTITDCGDGKGNGFTFKTYNAHDMLWAINRGIAMFYDKKSDWKKLVWRGMNCDNSWGKSAGSYIEAYKEAMM